MTRASSSGTRTSWVRTTRTRPPDDAQGGNRRGYVANAAQRHIVAVYRPQSGWVAVKVINHRGDEVMRVFAAGEQGGRRRECADWIAGMKEESQARAEDPGATREVEGVLC